MSALDAGALDAPARLEALKQSGLLRHDIERRLDILCETACMILRTPKSQVNVLDDKFQWSIGKWPPDDERIRAVAESACQVVVTTQTVVAVSDMLEHPIMCQIPFVRDVGARAYLGVPIFFNGLVVGSFCAVDLEVRRWTAWDTAGLQGLARLAGLAVAA